jgi:hypothetical protein
LRPETETEADMAKTIGIFRYDIVKMKKTDVIPGSSFVHICLQRWSRDESDVPILTPQLMTDGEIDGYVNALKADLDSVGRRAKAALARAKASTLKIVADRMASRRNSK